MADENLGPFVATAEHVPQTPVQKGPRESLTHVEKTSASKRPHVSEVPEASEASESTVEIQPEGANWAFRGRLARFGVS
jgi:hypothetical protein